MKNQIFLDHCYNFDQNFKFYKKLEKLGFVLDKKMTEHPGKTYCKFISFHGNNIKKMFYLEFVSFGKGSPKLYKDPGLSFGYNNNLESFYKKLNKKIPSKYSHRNYKWKENSIDRLPGWNFLSFEKPLMKNIFAWITENEPCKDRKPLKIPRHKNSAKSIHGIVLELTSSSKKKLEIILGKKLNDKFDMGDGTFIYIKKSKADRFASIVLNCDSLKTAKNMIGRSGRISVFDDREAITISPASYESGSSWNIILI